MRIAFLVNVFPSLSETFILNQIIDLLKRGHEIDIYAKSLENGAVHQKINEFNILKKTYYPQLPRSRSKRLRTVISMLLKSGNQFKPLLDTLNFFKYGRAALSFSLFFQQARFLNKPAYDIIHAHFGPNGNYATKLKNAGFLKAKIVTTFHGFDINPLELDQCRRNYKELFFQGNLFTVNSDFTRDLLIKAGCSQNKILKLPVGLDTSFYRNNNKARSSEIVHIGFCGRLIPFKAPDRVIEIARYLIFTRGNKNVKFFLIGTGEMKEIVLRLIDDYKLHEYVVLLGSKTQEEIINIMSEWDIFLYPGIQDAVSGRVENQGLVIQEAQALELPVVTSKVGGIPEGIVNNISGFTIEQDNIEEFCNKIELLIKDSSLRQRMGKEGRNFVEKNFDSKVLGNTLEKAYYKILEAE